MAPLLGSLQGYDQGAMDLYVGFLNPLLVYNDHAVIYRFIPIDRERSVQRSCGWFTRTPKKAAVTDLQRLTWLWDATTKADKHIIEKNQKEANSRFYQPGPLAEMEAFTQPSATTSNGLARWTTAEARPEEETELMTDEEMLYDDVPRAARDIWGEGFLSPGGPMVARVLEGLDLSGKTVLDIGCGSGAIAVLLARDYGAGSVVGIDVEDGVCNACTWPTKERRRPGQHPQGDPGAAGLRRSELRRGVFQGLDHPHPDKEALSADVFHILVPGGWFAASDWLIAHDGEPSPDMQAYIAAEALEFAMSSPGRYSALEQAGFEHVTLRNRNPWYRDVAQGDGHADRAGTGAVRARPWRGFHRRDRRDLDQDGAGAGERRALPPPPARSAAALTGP